MPEVRLGVETASNSILANFVSPMVVPAEFFGQCPEWRTEKPNAGREGRLMAIFRAGVQSRLGNPKLLRRDAVVASCDAAPPSQWISRPATAR